MSTSRWPTFWQGSMLRMPPGSAGEGQYGGEARQQCCSSSSRWRAISKARPHPALHRIHGRRRLERLEHGRSRALRRGRAPHRRRAALAPVAANYTGETAARWRYLDGGGEVGVISSVTGAFCKDCSRMRLSTEGKLYTCCSRPAATTCARCCVQGTTTWRSAARLPALGRRARTAIRRPRTAATPRAEPGARKVEMSYIGG